MLMLPMTYRSTYYPYTTLCHSFSIAKIGMLTSAILTYAYGMEYFVAWYSQNPYEQAIFYWRAVGDYAPQFWMMVFCNCVAPLVWYSKAMRTNVWSLFIVSILINIGMWLERFNIIVSSLTHNFDPAMWSYYTPTWVEGFIFIGSFGWFLTLFLIFCKTF